MGRITGRDLVAASALLVAVLVPLGALWTHGGVLNFVDYNLPLTRHSLNAALAESISPWSGRSGLGAPNVGFLGTALFLGVYRALDEIMPISLASRALLVLLLWASALSAYAVLRRSYRAPAWWSFVGATFFVLNPWVFDEVSQGHLYTFEMLILAPPLVLAVPRLHSPGPRVVACVAVALALFIGSDYHFGILLVALYAVETLVYLLRHQWRSAVALVTSTTLGMLLLSVFAVPYLTAGRYITASNNPGAGDLDYFSNFTSWRSALTLLRPNLDAYSALSGWSGLLRLLAVLGAAVAVISMLVSMVGGAKRRLVSPALACATLSAFILCNGTGNGTHELVEWLYSHVPLAGIFRDPSKFAFYPLMLCLPAVTVGLEARRGDWHFPSRRLWLVGAGRSWLCGTTLRLLMLASVLPLALVGYSGLSRVPTSAQGIAAATTGGRTALLAPWQYVTYPGQPRPVTDPVQLYPSSALARLGPDYDSSPGNRYLRWLFTALYDDSTRYYGPLAAAAGIQATTIRRDIAPVTGDSTTQGLLSTANLDAALVNQQKILTDVNGTQQSISHSAAVVGATSTLLRLNGTTWSLLDQLLSLNDSLTDAAVCFSDQCPGSASGISVGDLSDLPPTGASDAFTVATVSGSDPSGVWVNGDTHPSELDGILTSQQLPAAYAQGSASGALTFARAGSHSGDLWLQVLRGPGALTYGVSCGSTRLAAATAPTANSWSWTWLDLGHVVDAGDCRATFEGTAGAIAGGRVGSLGQGSSAVLTADGAEGVVTAKHERPALPSAVSTSVDLRPGDTLSYSLPSSAAGHLYADVAAGDQGTVLLGASSRQTSLPRAGSGWRDLGAVSGTRAEVRVRKGDVVVFGVMVAQPSAMHSLANLKPSSPLVTSGDSTLATSGSDLRVESPSRYLVLRVNDPALWRVDGKGPIATYSGFGGIYALPLGGKAKVTSALIHPLRIGIGLSLATVLVLVVAIAVPDTGRWKRSFARLRRLRGRSV